MRNLYLVEYANSTVCEDWDGGGTEHLTAEVSAGSPGRANELVRELHGHPSTAIVTVHSVKAIGPGTGRDEVVTTKPTWPTTAPEMIP